VSDSALTASLGALARFFVGDGSAEETLTRVAELSVDALEPVTLAGITMRIEGRPRTAVFTDDLAPEIDRAQYDEGTGPCLTAFEEGRVTAIDSTREDGPWPVFRAAAAAHGVGSTLSVPLVVDGTAVGALNLYAARERAFSADDRAHAELFASQAAIVLANVRAYWEARDLSRGLSEAMKSRAVIEQAKGILMAAEGVDEDAAFDILVAASQRENLKVREIATRIVANAVERGRNGGDGS
jgi:GAF domain-containing protein